MGKAKEKSEVNLGNRKYRPASTPEEREQQLIDASYDLVEKRIIAGTATSQEVVHFLRLGSSRERLEMEKLKKENELLRAKAEAIETEKETVRLFEEAIAAMKSYGAIGNHEEDEE